MRYDISDDRLFIWIFNVHIFSIQQRSEAQFLISAVIIEILSSDVLNFEF